MAYTGEIISIAVAFSLTACALAAEVGTRHLGVRVMNVWRMLLAIVVSAAFAWAFTGSPLPEGTGLRRGYGYCSRVSWAISSETGAFSTAIS